MKLIVPERGGAEVAAIWLAAERRVSSLLLYPEARAAVGRAERMGRLPGPRPARARERLEGLWQGLDTIDVTTSVARRAGDLAERFALRAYDAVHLASCEVVADADTTLVSADRELLDAARALGLVTAPVG